MKNSLYLNIRKKAEQNRRTGATPKKPTAEMLRQERKIKAKQYPDGGTIIDPRGQWAHPGKRTIVPSPTGQITMQGVLYPVYGEDETGYGQIMYPNNEYQFPGQMIDETPIKMQAGGPARPTIYNFGERAWPLGFRRGFFDIPGVGIDNGKLDPTKRWALDNWDKLSLNEKNDFIKYSQKDFGTKFENAVSALAPLAITAGTAYLSKKGYDWLRDPKNKPVINRFKREIHPSRLIKNVGDLFNKESEFTFAKGGSVNNSEDDVFKSSSNIGKEFSKPVTDFYTNWFNDDKTVLRLDENFPAFPSVKDKVIYDPDILPQILSERNIHNIEQKIPGFEKSIANTKFLYNPDPKINQELIDNYITNLNPKYKEEVLKRMKENPQGFTDPEGNIIVLNPDVNATHKYSPLSIMAHEGAHKFSFNTKDGEKSLDKLMMAKFPTPKNNNVINEFDREELYPFLMQLRFDQQFKPGEIITPERLQEIKKSGYNNHLFRYYDDAELSKILNTLASNKQQSPYKQYAAQGGKINPYMYYAGGPIEYGKGGNFLKHVGAGAYAIAEGALDTITMGATDQLTDKGFEWLTKVGNKNMDLSDPKNAKFLKTQQQIKGYGNTAAAITTGIVTGNVKGAVSQSAKGLNTAFQASDWASDDFKKWSQGISSGVQFASGFMGGNPTSAVGSATSGANAASTASQASNVASSIGKGSNIANKAFNFGQKATDASKYINQVSGMIGGNEQPLWQQAEARQDYLNSPEYLAMKDEQNQEYLNRNFNNFITPTSPNLNFAATGGDINNLVTLQNPYSMKNRYKNYRTKYRQGGSMNQSNVDFISDEAGLHQENVYEGVPLTRGKGAYANGGAALVEAGEGVIRDEQGNPSFILPDQGNGEPVYMLQLNASYTDFERDKDGNYIQLPITVADWRKKEEKRGSNFRDPENDYISNPRKDNANQLAMAATEIQKQLKAQRDMNNEMMVNGALQYAAAGGKLNKDLEKILSNDIQRYVEADNYYAYGGYLPRDKRFNMPNSYAKGGSIHIKESKKGTFTAAAKKRGKSVQEFAKQVLANKGNYSAAMVKKANFARNAAKWHHAEGGPMVSNVQQPFEVAAQNRGGMLMDYANGGYVYQPMVQPMLAEGGNMYYQDGGYTGQLGKEHWTTTAAGLGQVIPDIAAGTMAISDLIKGRYKVQPEKISSQKFNVEPIAIGMKGETAENRALYKDYINRSGAPIGVGAAMLRANLLKTGKDLGKGLSDLYTAKEQFDISNQRSADVFNAESRFKAGQESRLAEDKLKQNLLSASQGVFGKTAGYLQKRQDAGWDQWRIQNMGEDYMWKNTSEGLKQVHFGSDGKYYDRRTGKEVKVIE